MNPIKKEPWKSVWDLFEAERERAQAIPVCRLL